MSAPLYRRQTAAAAGFANRYAPLLRSQGSDAHLPAGSDHEA
jgi:hypothetical protein